MRGVARDATGDKLALEHDHSSDAASAQFDRSRETCRSGADNRDIDHDTPIHSLIGRPETLAASAHTLAAQ